jgi:hypothetical protein
MDKIKTTKILQNLQEPRNILTLPIEITELILIELYKDCPLWLVELCEAYHELKPKILNFLNRREILKLPHDEFWIEDTIKNIEDRWLYPWCICENERCFEINVKYAKCVSLKF